MPVIPEVCLSDVQEEQLRSSEAAVTELQKGFQQELEALRTDALVSSHTLTGVCVFVWVCR